MKISKQIKELLSTYPYAKTITFKELRLQLDDSTIKVDSFKHAMHRLHKQGVITISGRGQFVKEDAFKTYLFVYGSLKRGFENHSILSEAKYISKAKTTSTFAMYLEDDRNYPYIIKDTTSTGSSIDGELYEIMRKDLLDKVNTFEGVPDYFKCSDVYVQTRSKKVKAKAYILADPKVPLYQEPIKSFKSKKIKANIDFDEYHRIILGLS